MAIRKQLEPVTIEDARIIFRNFAGKAGKYNREGDRSFAVLLPSDVAVAMLEDGWNVKYLNQREEDDEPQAYVGIKLNFNGGRPPRVVVISSRGRTNLDEDSVEILDWADIAKVDLIINPYHYDVSGSTGVSAYLKSIFVTINEDELDLKYADLDEIPTRSGRVNEGD